MQEKEYTVTWSIDVYATTPRKAVLQAVQHLLQFGSTATVFDTRKWGLSPGPLNKRVDLGTRTMDRLKEEAYGDACSGKDQD